MAAEELQMTDLCVKSEMFEGAYQPSIKTKEHDKVEEGRCKRVKQPRRVLHFSDGTMEEYSTDEEEEKPQPDPMALVDPKSLTWGPWMYYWLLYTGSSALSACDYVGESLANFLGITSPKYQYEIEEYQRCLEEEKKQKEEEDAEMAGWSAPAQTISSKDDQVVPGATVQQAPSPSHSLKQNLQEGEDKTVGGGSFASQIPTVTITTESDAVPESLSVSQEKDASAVPGKDSTKWDRF